MRLDLRPYQLDQLAAAEAALGKYGESLLVLPTGGGKTEIAIELLRRRREAVANFTALVVMQSLDLKSQWIRRVNGWLGDGAAGDEHSASPIKCATVQSVGKDSPRWEAWREGLARPDLLIVDEAHHAIASSYQRVIDAFSGAELFGMTACPELLSKTRSLDEVFLPEAMIQGLQTLQLVQAQPQYLANIRAFAPQVVARSDFKSNSFGDDGAAGGDYQLAQADEQVNLHRGQIIDEFRKVAADATGWRPTLVFCGTNAGADGWAETLREVGVRAAAFHSGIDADQLAAARAGFDAGQLDALVTVGKFIEGIDAPHAEVLLGLRPTKSLNYFLQMVGRLLRMKYDEAGDPIEKVYLDCVGNIGAHGHPFALRDWDITERREKGAGGVAVPPGDPRLSEPQVGKMVEVHPPRLEAFNCPAGCGVTLPPLSVECSCGWTREAEERAEALAALVLSLDALTAADCRRECDRLTAEHQAREAAKWEASEAERRERERQARAEAEQRAERGFWESDTLPLGFTARSSGERQADAKWIVRVHKAFEWAVRKGTPEAFDHLAERVGYPMERAKRAAGRHDQFVMVLMVARHLVRHYTQTKHYWVREHGRVPEKNIRRVWDYIDSELGSGGEAARAKVYAVQLGGWNIYAVKHRLIEWDGADAAAAKKLMDDAAAWFRASPLHREPWGEAKPPE